VKGLPMDNYFCDINWLIEDVLLFFCWKLSSWYRCRFLFGFGWRWLDFM